MQTIHILKSVAELDALTDDSQRGPVVLFKHSLTCPISARAQSQFVKLSDVPRYALAVQYAQDVSRAVAERFGAEHATPQLLVIENGEVQLNLTHDDVKATAVETHLAQTH